MASALIHMACLGGLAVTLMDQSDPQDAKVLPSGMQGLLCLFLVVIMPLVNFWKCDLRAV